MELSFNSSNFHYAFGTHDRVTIEGMPYRPASHNESGYVMTMTDGAGLSKSFTHEQLSRLGSMGRIHQEPNYFRPEEAARRLSSTTGLISALPKKQTARLSRRLCRSVFRSGKARFDQAHRRLDHRQQQ